MAELTRYDRVDGEPDERGDLLLVEDVIDRLEDLAILDPEACYAGVNKLLVELRDGKVA